MSCALSRYPLVSVGVPVFNEEAYIEEMLISIHRQNYPNLEVLISDNFSSDDTWNIISRVTKTDPRFRAVRQSKNQGAVYNFEYALKQARGEFFIWAGGHDLWGPNMIENLVVTFEKNPGAVLCAPRTRWIDKDGNFLFEKEVSMDTRLATTPAGRILLFLKQRERCNAVYGLHRREVLLSTWPWPKASDFLGLLRIASVGDIITDDSVYWCRRVVRSETLPETLERRAKMLRRAPIVVRFHYLIITITTIKEVISYEGSLSDRFQLISYVLRYIVFQPTRLKSLAWEMKKNFVG